MTADARCRACRKPIIWAKLSSGAWIPLDVEAQPRPFAKLVAFNWSTGGGRVLKGEDIDSGAAALWLRAGRVTVHYSHMRDESCPMVQARRARPGQVAA